MRRAAVAGFTAGVSSVCGLVLAAVIAQAVIDRIGDGGAPCPR